MKTKQNHYEKSPVELNTVLKTILKTEIGRRILEEFLPLYSRKKIIFEAYPKEMVETLLHSKNENAENEPIGACIVFHSSQYAKIHYDSNASLGVLIPFLFHEICHAVDSRMWKNQYTIECELDAFEKQYRLIEELKRTDLQYEVYLKSYYSKSRLLGKRLTAEEIRALYLKTTEFDRKIAA